MNLELEGIIKEIGGLQEFNEGSFKKKTILLTIEPGDFEQHIPIDASQKNLAIFDAMAVGDKVRVSINLRSNEYQGKHYPSINAWKVSIVEKGTGIPDSPTIEVEPQGAAPPADDEDTDLPF